MPIQFDSLAEVQAFCNMFEPRQAAAFKSSQVPLNRQILESKGKTAEVASKSTNTTKKAVKSTTKIRAEKPNTRATKIKAPKALKPRQGNSTTYQVAAAIDTLIAAKATFSANDVFSKVSESNASVSKPTVLSLTSKLLSTKYSHITTEERPSTGFRPMKVYLPTGH